MDAKPKRPWPARSRTLPSDEKSLERQIRTLHGEIVQVAQHLSRSWRDLKSRRRLLILHDQRAASWGELYKVNPKGALELASECKLLWSGTIPHITEVNDGQN